MSVERGSLAGKVCLITGGTSGIGRATAEALAARGGTVVIVSRNAARGARAVAEMRRAAGHEDVHYLAADLSAQSEVLRVAESYRQRFDRLDVLVNNAGAIFSRRQETVDGLEMTFALNHLAYVGLTCRLLDLLLASAPSRVIVVASDAHRRATLDLDDLQSRHGYSAWGAYNRSKLANVLFAYELAQRLGGTGVTVNAVHPGFVHSGFARGLDGPLGAATRLAFRFGVSPERGADTVVYLATSPEVEEVTGMYYRQREAVMSSEASYDSRLARSLWEISFQAAGLEGAD